MGIAFEMALVALRLAGRGDLANKVLAHRISDLAKAGERDPERLYEGVPQESRAPPHVKERDPEKLQAFRMNHATWQILRGEIASVQSDFAPAGPAPSPHA